ncbi:MAG: diacylglycerol/lipid kinase family protein [Jatrophihabitans sp.]
MRVLVIANPRATATTPRERRVLANALGAHAELTIEETANRGHAAALACRAMREEVEVVIALGGDGTVNEVINGALTDGVHAKVPSIGVVPAGSTNVFAQALGLPNDPVAATDEMIDALRSGHRRVVSLGRAEDRWFTFAAGIGLDAAVVAGVEKQRRRGRRSTHALYVRTAVREFYRGDRRHGAITLSRPDGTKTAGLHMAVVANTSPWTYLGTRPVTPTPSASFDAGLDVYARRRMGLIPVLYALPQLLRAGEPRDRGALVEHDLPGLTLSCDRPMPFQVDGDYLGERTEVQFWSIPRAISMVC